MNTRKSIDPTILRHTARAAAFFARAARILKGKK